MNTTKILHHYLVCALWSSCDTDDQDTPLDEHYGVEDIASDSITLATQDIGGFLALCAEQKLDLDGLTEEQIGHDFWLTRNHHGAGFWDRGLGKFGDELTEIAHSFGPSDGYVGDDNKVYLS